MRMKKHVSTKPSLPRGQSDRRRRQNRASRRPTTFISVVSGQICWKSMQPQRRKKVSHADSESKALRMPPRVEDASRGSWLGLVTPTVDEYKTPRGASRTPHLLVLPRGLLLHFPALRRTLRLWFFPLVIHDQLFTILLVSVFPFNDRTLCEL